MTPVNKSTGNPKAEENQEVVNQASESSSSNNHAPQSAHVRRGQLDCCDGLQGEGCVVSAAGVQAALLADVGATGRLRVAPCAAPCQRPILGHGSFRISSQVQAASNCLLFDCHRWRYDTQFCETTKQDGFGGVSGPETGPLESVSSNARFMRRPGDDRRSHNRVLMYLTL